MVLVYDLLFGKGIQCGGPLKQAINRHKVELKKMLPAAVKKHGGRTQSQQSGTARKPIPDTNWHILSCYTSSIKIYTTDLSVYYAGSVVALKTGQ